MQLWILVAGFIAAPFVFTAIALLLGYKSEKKSVHRPTVEDK